MIDPVMTPVLYGPYLTASLLCVGLFVTTMIFLKVFSDKFVTHIETEDKNFTELKQNQGTTLTSIRDIAESINHLADAITTQSTMHHEQLELLREQSGDIKIMLANQAAAQGNLQQLLERVVDKL
jgi:peptidoglycan hydrolase CwlO-like protein